MKVNASRFLNSCVPVLVLLGTALSALPDGATSEVAGPVEHAFIVTTDYYSAGYYSTIEIPPPRGTMVSIEPTSMDPVVYYDWTEDMIFIVNRYLADNIQIVDNDPLFTTLDQYSVGNGSNPHDIRLVDNTKAYVSRYEWKTLLIVHPYFGDSLGVVDFSSLADEDGIPEMDRMEIVGTRLFVTLNNIDRTTWLPDGPGKVGVVDVEADTLVDCDPAQAGIQPIVLTLPNPYTELRYDPCKEVLWVSCLGAWGVLDGGIEVIDPYTLKSKGVVMTEAELGGDVSDAVLTPRSGGYAVVLDPAPWPDNYARLVRFDLETRTVTDTLFQQTSGMGSSLAGIELNRQGELYLCDRDLVHPGVRIFDTLADTLAAFIDVGLPPFDIAFLQTPLAGIEKTPGALDRSDTLSIRSRPNPFTSSTEITYTLPVECEVMIRLDIFDATGRRVRSLAGPGRPERTHSVRWDGRDDGGRSVSPGLYFCRAAGLGRPAAAKLLLLR